MRLSETKNPEMSEHLRVLILPVEGRMGLGVPEAALAAQAQTLDQRLVAAFFLALDVVQQTAALADHD